MFKELKPYPAYKESGSSWLGRIPVGWDLRRMRYLLREIDRRSIHGDEQLLRVSQYTGVTERKVAGSSQQPDTRAASLVNYKRVAPADLVVNIMLAWNGSLGVSPYDGIVSPAYCVYRFAADVDVSYFHHLLRSPAYRARIRTMSTGVVESRLRLYTDRLYRIEGLVPPATEQAAIVKYLGHANARIDRAIATKRKLIALLEEQKQAIISDAFIRVPDSRTRVAGSDRTTVGRIVQFVTSGSRGWADHYSDDGPIFLQSGNLGKDARLNLERVQRVSPPPGMEGQRTLVKKGDVLVCITGAKTGNVALVDQTFDESTYVNQHVALIRPKCDMVDSRYLALVLHSDIGQAQFRASQYGGTKQGLGLADVRAVKVDVPSLVEQSRIVDIVNRAIADSLEMVIRMSREIELLREFRTRLIADVVTGQLDVREIAAGLPDLDPSDLAGDVGADVEDDLDTEAAEFLEDVDA